MKLHDSGVEIERVGVETENSFTIKTTAKAFDILSSGLYTDSITAIIRELSCNAYDSHVAAGKRDTPFVIHLPNTLEPFLSIRDFGTGLSDDDVLHFYTTYFDSSKTTSNEYIGALGLGSKSPFSYTTSYEVISRYNGYIRSYLMFINEHGIPDVVKMTTQTTTEGNGLEVKIGIDPSDFNTVAKKTASCLKHFAVLPEVVGVVAFKFDPLPTNNTIKHNNWMVFGSSSVWGYSTDFTAVQGNVQYKVDTKQLTDELSSDDMSLFGHLNVIGYFNIGDLDVAASREEIRYDKKSKQALSQFIRTMIKELAELVTDKSNIRDTYWDTCVELTELSTKLFGNRYIMQTIISLRDGSHPMLDRYASDMMCVTLPSSLYHHSVFTYSMGSMYLSKPYTRKRTGQTLEPAKHILILKQDCTSGGIKRMVEYAKANRNFKQVIIISEHKRKYSDDKMKTIPSTEEEYANIVQSLGDPTIHQLSELCPPLPKDDTVRTLKSYSYRTYYGDRVCWDKLDVDVAQGGIFFVLKNGSNIVVDYGSNERNVLWKANQVENRMHQMVSIINDAKGTQFVATDIVGVPVSTWKKIKNDPNWVDGFQVILDQLPQFLDHINIIRRTNVTVRTFGVMDCIKIKHIRDQIKTLAPHSQFAKCTAEAVADWDNIDSTEQLQQIELMTDMYSSIVERVAVKPYFEYNDFDTYPLFPLIVTLPKDMHKFKASIDYITLIDEKNKL